jgi:hypothetical protein
MVNCTSEFKHYASCLGPNISAKSSLKPGYSAAVIWSACHADARHVKLPQALIDERCAKLASAIKNKIFKPAENPNPFGCGEKKQGFVC